VTVIKTYAQLGVILAILAAASVLAVINNTITGSQAYDTLVLIGTATAVSGGYVLASPVPNSQLGPHLIITLAAIGMATGLGLEHVWDSGQIQGVFSTVLGGGVAGVIAGNTAANPPPPTGTRQNLP
jgi:hypothetical protein